MNEKPLKKILRKESFGGVFFDPNEALILEMDRPAFRLLKKMQAGRKRFYFPSQKKFLAQFEGETTIRDIHSWRVHENPRLITPRELMVFSAPTLIDLQITSCCDQDCPHCYAGSRPQGNFMERGKLDRILRQCSEAGVFQIALGGGEPLLHPEILWILERISDLGMVPNLTTSGAHFSPEILSTMKRHCGAVALSLEAIGEKYSQRRKLGFRKFEEALRTLLEYEIPAVLQVTLSAENFSELNAITEWASGFPLYGVIFLSYKPVGRGKNFHHPLSRLDAAEVSRALERSFKKLSGRMRVGYDCCLAPAVSALSEVEGCSATRGSAGVTITGDLVPCTFLPELTLGSLFEKPLLEIWADDRTHAFRASLLSQSQKPGCEKCQYQFSCLGGCPKMDLVGCTLKTPQKNTQKNSQKNT